MNPHPKDTGEWLAYEAVRHAYGDHAHARLRLTHALQALALWGDGCANDNAIKGDAHG